MEEDEEALLNRLSLDASDVEAEVSLGCLFLKDGRTDDGLTALRRAIALQPGHIDARRYLAFALHHYERFDEAEAALRDWQRYDPDSPVACHMLSAFSGTAVPARAADEYIRLMFDRAAPEYDDHIASLGYRGAYLIQHALPPALGPPAAALDILDAGCGTGLCGPAVRPYARRLVGVDLSGAMLSRASERGCYDGLESAELTGFMIAHPSAFDLVVAADTLNYFGDLGPALAAASMTLRPLGKLVFTVEAAVSDEPCSRLNANGRFSHTEAYLLQSIARAGLAVCTIGADVLRREGGTPVAGFIVTAQKIGTTDEGEAS
jgi:predicted TPR repeat methyltransferase